jgi:undecaprenyl-diphosphatase
VPAPTPATELAATGDGTEDDGDGEQVDAEAADAEMTWWKAAVLGVVEGVTEYLPISSTGHLLVTQRILGIGEDDATKDAADSYAIAIQFGAILAVLVLYRRRVASLFRGLAGRDPSGRALLVALVCATAPAVVVALLFERPIKDNLLGPWPVVVAWAVGGAALLVIAPKVRADRPGFALERLGWRPALVIGAAQVVAMWPGTSRSLVTILAGLAVGMTLAAAVEFSFLLGLVTLGGATLYETASNGSTMVDAYGVVDPLVGLLFAFLAAVVAVRWMVDYLQSRSLAIFGWERLAAAAVTVGLLLAGTI